MPNEPAGQFPLPPLPANPPPPTYEPPQPAINETPREVKLTDATPPDLSAPPPAPPTLPRQSEGDGGPLPRQSTSDGGSVPATPPTRNGGLPVVTTLLLIITTAAIGATYFFYQQTQTLSSQLSEVSRTLERRRIQENQITITPSPSTILTPEVTVAISPTATPTSLPITEPIEVSVKTNPHLVMADLKKVIATAQKQYPNAQLLMIVSTGLENPDTTITKYWFRQTSNDKKYLYILSEPDKNYALVDQQVYLTPDSNIPSLNQLAISGGLGLDLVEALKIANDACPTTFDCTATPISAQFVKANTTLWQVAYKPTDGRKPFVVQIDSITKRILFRSL